MGGEVNAGVGSGPHGIRQHVVVRRTTLICLQSFDDGITLVVADDEDHFVAGQHRSVNVGVHHQIRAIADHGKDFAVGSGHCGTPRTRDFISHAGITVFTVETGDRFAHPVDIELPRQSTSGSENVILFGRSTVHQPN